MKQTALLSILSLILLASGGCGGFQRISQSFTQDTTTPTGQIVPYDAIAVRNSVIPLELARRMGVENAPAADQTLIAIDTAREFGIPVNPNQIIPRGTSIEITGRQFQPWVSPAAEGVASTFLGPLGAPLASALVGFAGYLFERRRRVKTQRGYVELKDTRDQFKNYSHAMTNAVGELRIALNRNPELQHIDQSVVDFLKKNQEKFGVIDLAKDLKDALTTSPIEPLPNAEHSEQEQKRAA